MAGLAGRLVAFRQVATTSVGGALRSPVLAGAGRDAGSVAVALPRATLGGRRALSAEADSHDDFKPKSKVATATKDIAERIREDVQNNKVVLYMKGLPSAPQCGFSYKTVLMLNSLGVEYRAFNVLSSDELREGIKAFSDWPTIPQVYVDGEFLGGCDIIANMFSSGDLQKLLVEKEIPTSKE